MTEIFFISDTHFGHSKILEFESESRPFVTIEAHDQELVKRWNAVVKPSDKVYHLGDVVFGRKNLPILKELYGRKRLVMGNHDIFPVDEYAKYFEKIFGARAFNRDAILTHIPVHEDQLNRYRINIHGHLHKKVLDNPRYVNVSCEQINLTPVAYDEIMSKWRAKD